MKRRWLLWILVIAFIWVVIGRLNEISKLAQTLSQGRWEWVLAAALLQVIYYVVFTASYQSAFSTVEVKSRLRKLLPVMFASIFVNVAAPTGGTGGAALFVDDAARRGESASRAAAGMLLMLAADFTAFLALLIPGIIDLSIHHELQAYELAGAIILLLMIGGLVGILAIGFIAPNLLQRLLRWVQRVVNTIGNRFKHSELLDSDWADKNASDFSAAAAAITSHPTRLAQTILLAIAAHLLDLATLFALFMAFSQSVTFGTLVAGYAMGILFWIVSITPQGVGVVEAVMALVYTSLGVPMASATIIALAFRGLTFWLPLLIGFNMLNRVESFRGNKKTQTEVWSVRLVAIGAGLMGIVNVISALTPSLHYRIGILDDFVSRNVRHGAHLTAALAGFALLVLAGNLWRRKRVAWMATLVLLSISIVSHLTKGLDYEEAILAIGLAIWLWKLGPHFHALSDPPSVRQGLIATLAAFLFTLGYGVAGFFLLDRHFSVNFSLIDALYQTIAMFTQSSNPGLQPITKFGWFFADSIYTVSIVTGSYAIIMLTRPVLLRSPATVSEREQAAEIVEKYGRSSLARVALFDDKSYFFSAGGTVIAYALKGRVALALGDPIGPREDAVAAIDEFMAYCSRNDWRPAFYQTLPDYEDIYKAAGFELISVGQEAIVDLHEFTLEGGANKSARTSVNRLTKAGYTARVHEPPLSDEFLEEIRSVSNEWLEAMMGAEKRYSLGWFDDEYIRSSPIMAIHAPDDSVIAFANIVPEYRINESTVDLMRRRRNLDSGTMDFLFISLFQWARGEGYDTFNLGLSPLAGVGIDADDPAVERALHYIYEHVNQFYGFKGLHAFKEKFHPAWSPRFLVYPGAASLPSIAIALIRADSGDNFMRDYIKDFYIRHIRRRKIGNRD